MDVRQKRPEFFTGRQDALDRIHSVFWPPGLTVPQPHEPHHSDRKKIVISGPRGVGKTAVALEYAYAHRAYYYVVVLLDAQTADTLANSASTALGCVLNKYKSKWGDEWPRQPELSQRVASALRMLDDPVTDFSGLVKEAAAGQNSVERLMAWLPNNLPWLLILDGYDDPWALDTDRKADPRAFAIDRLLPKTAVGHVLITSQHHDPCSTDEQIAITSLKQNEGVKLLMSAAGRQRASCCSGRPGT